MIINGEKIYLSSNYHRVMDKNTLTGLILIGAVIISFMFLNKPNEINNVENICIVSVIFTRDYKVIKC